jgi:putative DNA primase/helicase
MTQAHDTAMALWHLGANVTAIAAGGKGPRYRWKDRPPFPQRQSEAQMHKLPWGGFYDEKKKNQVPAADRAGIIHGPDGCNGWRCFDVDAIERDGSKVPVSGDVCSALLRALELPGDYPWALRSRSGAGWHVFVRCTDDMPAGALTEKANEKGVYFGVPLDDSDDFNHLELRWHGVQTVYAGDTVPTEPPALAGVDQVLAAFRAIAQTPQSKRATRDATPRQHATNGTADPPTDTYAENALKAIIGEMAMAREGTRNSTLFKSACRVHQFIEAGRLGADALGQLERAARGAGLSDGEIAETLASAARQHHEPERAGLPDERRANGRRNGHGPPPPPIDRETGEVLPSGVEAEGGVRGVSITEHLDVLDPDYVAACAERHDDGTAELLAYLYRDRLCFDFRENCWHYWAGNTWHRDTTEMVRRVLSGQIAAQFLYAAGQLGKQLAQLDPTNKADKAEHARLKHLVECCMKRANALRSTAGTRSALDFAKSYLPAPTDPSDPDRSPWDAAPWLFAVRNGVLNLKTGELHPGHPRDYMRTCAPVEWRGLHTPAPRWEQFVSEVMSHEADRGAFLQRLLGYSLNGSTREHILVLLIGERGRNGKRVLAETVQAVMGEYASTANNDVILGDSRRNVGGAEPHLVSLMGRRFVTCSESEAHDRLSVAQVKRITGGDRITARRLHANLTTFEPTHTIFLQTNRKPHAPADDDALWERIRVIEFRARFVDDPNPDDANEHPRDLELEETLTAEHSGILAWMVRGGLDWLQGGLRAPDSVKLARQNYRTSESIEPFVDACCYEDASASAESGILYEAYKRWCELRGQKPKTSHWFGRQAKAIFERNRNNVGRYCYYGIGLLDDSDWSTEPEKGSETSDDSKKVRRASESDKTASQLGASEPFQEFAKESDMYPSR